jgi:hypothetical protein
MRDVVKKIHKATADENASLLLAGLDEVYLGFA